MACHRGYTASMTTAHTKPHVVKVAISLDRELFEQVNAAAKDEHTTRSGLISAAIRDFLVRYENEEILSEIDRVYCAPRDTEEQRHLDAMVLLHREVQERNR